IAADDPRRRRGSRDAGDRLRRRTRHPGDRLPHRAAHARRRVPEAHRPRDPGLRLQGTVLRGLWTLTWLEVKIFAREPLGLIGSIGIPVVIFITFGRISSRARVSSFNPDVPSAIGADLPIMASLLITISTLLSLIAIIAIYREGGILRRLRATPLRPYTILTAQVLVKLLFTALTLAAM